MMSTFPSAPVIPNHFDLAFLLNPKNQPLFAQAFLRPEHKYLEEQYHTICQLQDLMWKLDNLLKFTVDDMKHRGISALIFTIKDLQLANQHLQSTLRKQTTHQGRPRPHPLVTTQLQNQSTPQISNKSSFHTSITKEFSSILNKPKCVPPRPNTPSAIINLSVPMPPPGMTSSHSIKEIPELLINKVFPACMRCTKCFQCQRTGHFKSFCPYYYLQTTSSSALPTQLSILSLKDSPPYHSEDNDEDDEENNDILDQILDDPEHYDDLDGAAWGNIIGEPAGL
jgi:hypothetical protein